MRHFRFILIPAVLFLLPGYGQAGWVQQPSGTTAPLTSVYFINPQTGWIAGVAGDTNFILRTTDSGSHWERHEVDIAFGSSLHLIRFWDSYLGFAGSRSRLYRSTDSGIDWQQVPQSFFGISNLVFVTPSKGWLVCAAPVSGDGGVGSLHQTTDSGATWAIRDSSHFMYCDISFADTLFGMLTADNHAVLNDVSAGFMKRTTNGGATWDSINYTFGTAYDHIRFSSPNCAWRTTYSFFPGYPYYRGVQKTTNRGGSWITIWGGHESGLQPPIAVPDTLNGWVLISDTLFNTRDAGATWFLQIPPGSYFHDLFFTDPLNGWLVGSNGLILHTTDGGSGVWEEPAPTRLTPFTSRFTVLPNPFTSFASVPGHSSDRFALYDVSGRRVGTYRGDRIGEGLIAGVYFVKPEGQGAKPLRIVKVR